jgi:pimeloyl-ACP methyl ester carboxylesterase
MTRYTERVKPLVEMGYIALLFDMRGHGETGGDLNKYSCRDHLNDCLAAYDFIKHIENVDIHNVSVLGSSYGGYLATLLTSKRPVHHLVLKAPAQYPDDSFETPTVLVREKGIEAYRFQHHTKSDNMALRAISEYDGDLLFIECEKDEQVPKQVMDDYRSVIMTRYDYELLLGADHACRTPGSNEAMIAVMETWFQKLNA